MRAEILSALRSLSDTNHQRTRWGRHEAGVNYYDDFTLNVHTLYDDCMVLPDPASSIGELLIETEVDPLRQLGAILTPLIDELGDVDDSVYLADPRWSVVVSRSGDALRVMLGNG